ncbi:AMP-binding protein [Marinobacter sp. 1-3A]|nr:AMP-binding protein [Marinobacter sp. 1-3A]
MSPKLLVCDSQFIDKAEEVSSGCGVDIAFSININGDSKNRTSFKGFTSNSSVNPVCENIHGDDIWEILFTSGSSSLPKGVMVSHIKTYFEALSFSNITPLKLSQPSQITVCSYLPIIYHVGFCMLLAGILSGGKTVIGRGLNFRSLAETIERERVTTLWAGSPQALELTATEYAALNGGKNVLKNAIFGWGAMSPKVYREIKKSFGDEFSGIAIIGQTESCCAHRFFIDEHPEIFETECPQENYIGLPSPLLGAAIEYVEGVSVTNESGEVQNGEAVYRSPAMMAGYYKDPEATKEALSGGWFHSGDNFGLMSKGQRTMIDRIKDVIKTGGENVSSIRVEGIINQFSSVSRSAVIGVPHKKWGEAVIALVILKEGVEYDELSLISHLKKKLSSFEVPKSIILEQSFPEPVGGKVQKYKLREKYKNIFQQ